MEEGKEYFEQIETEDHVIPNFYELKVVGADGQEKVLTVEVEKATQEMPYLGGYRSKKTAAQYLHAGSNTDQYRKEYKEKLTREVQTYQYRTRSTKMHREMGSQMDKTGVVFVDPREDKAVDSSPTSTARCGWNSASAPLSSSSATCGAGSPASALQRCGRNATPETDLSWKEKRKCGKEKRKTMKKRYSAG